MKTAQLILTHDNHDLTRNLLKSFPSAVVIDNGSIVPVDYTDNVIRFDENLGFVKGFNEAIKRVYNDYDSFWLCNNDIETEFVCLPRLQEILESHPRLGIVSPYSNSPHEQMHKHTSDWLRYVSFVEMVAPLIAKKTFDKVGLLDSSFEKGWGIDYDFCWQARRNGFAVGVYDLVGIKHLEHKTIDLLGREEYFKEASNQMNTHLTRKYGSEWKQLIESMVALTMVVCNEEPRLEEFFDYHTDLVDEIVIAVQESKDNSLAICKEHADTILSTPCVGYCEADRDLVSKNTNSDWQLCLDPDEFLTDEFIRDMRKLTQKNMGYRLTRRLIEDGEFRFQGDMHHRFYHRNNVKFLNELHTEPQARDWNKVSALDYVSINHIKTLNETLDDEYRYENVIETKYKNSATYNAKKQLNIHIRGLEQRGK